MAAQSSRRRCTSVDSAGVASLLYGDALILGSAARQHVPRIAKVSRRELADSITELAGRLGKSTQPFTPMVSCRGRATGVRPFTVHRAFLILGGWRCGQACRLAVGPDLGGGIILLRLGGRLEAGRQSPWSARGRRRRPWASVGNDDALGGKRMVAIGQRPFDRVDVVGNRRAWPRHRPAAADNRQGHHQGQGRASSRRNHCRPHSHVRSQRGPARKPRDSGPRRDAHSPSRRWSRPASRSSS